MNGLRYESNHLVFSTGRRAYVGDGTVGLDPFDGTLKAHYGFDGEVGEFEAELSPAEREELADAMIAAWTRYKAA